ncbi:hypothetical protein [Kitasatospora sp. NPDC093679]|uniref:hypothetical protein n=1 Tax=Kitasatospora sp. NPDC093679 TaxID=3154983 RepID=UPI0034202912
MRPSRPIVVPAARRGSHRPGRRNPLGPQGRVRRCPGPLLPRARTAFEVSRRDAAH